MPAFMDGSKDPAYPSPCQNGSFSSFLVVRYAKKKFLILTNAKKNFCLFWLSKKKIIPAYSASFGLYLVHTCYLLPSSARGKVGKGFADCFHLLARRL
jgi:hypothetical protein